MQGQSDILSPKFGKLSKTVEVRNLPSLYVLCCCIGNNMTFAYFSIQAWFRRLISRLIAIKIQWTALNAISMDCCIGLMLQYSLYDICCLSDSPDGLQKKTHVTVTLIAINRKILQTPWIISKRLNKCNSYFCWKMVVPLGNHQSAFPLVLIG